MNKLIATEEYNLLCEDASLRNLAFKMYLNGEDVIEIAEKLHVDLEEVRYYAFGKTGGGHSRNCWNYLRKNIDLVAFQSALTERKDRLLRIIDVADGLISSELDKYYRRVALDPDYNISIEDLHKIAGISEKYDKMSRLEVGKPTDIKAQLCLTEEQHRELGRIMKDPFANVDDIVDVDYTEVKDE